MGTKYTDITGQKFNRLTAIKYLGGSRWECVCDCGATSIVNSKNLRNNTTKSCGCLRKDKMQERHKANSKINKGDRFGHLVILERDNELTSIKGSKWICKCDCGKICSVSYAHLMSGNKKSCGCSSHQNARLPFQIRREQYENLHGKIPKDYCVISLDGDTANVSERNLMAIKRQASRRLHRNGLFGLGDITQTAILIDELEQRCREVCRT